MQKFDVFSQWEASRDVELIQRWTSNITLLMSRADNLRLAKGLPPWELTRERVTNVVNFEYNPMPHDDKGTDIPFESAKVYNVR